jgi:multidrug resistance protein, MATE family
VGIGRQNDFLRRFCRLAIANIFANLMVPLAGLIDVALLGHLAEIHHLAGVALATVLFNYIYWTFGFLRMGTTGMTAQAIGRGDRPAVLLTGLRNGILALGIGLTILVLQQPLRELGFTVLSAAPEVKASGQAYYNTLIWGAPSTLLNFVLMGWFLGREQSPKVLLLSAVVNGTKIGLDYLFIVRWGWQGAGAGLAGAGSQYLMLLVGLLLVLQEIRWKEVQAVAGDLWNPAALKTALVLNGDILIRTFALVSTFSLFTNLSSAFGTVILATNTVLLEVVTLAAYLIDGLAFATESLAGIFRGNGNRQQLATLLGLSGGVSLGLGLTFALIFNLFPRPLFGLLTDHESILESLGGYTLWLLPVMGFGSIAYLLDGYFLGLTEGRILRDSSAIATLIGFLPLALVAWQFHNTSLLWLALSLFMAVRAITLLLQVPKTLQH